MSGKKCKKILENLLKAWLLKEITNDSLYNKSTDATGEQTSKKELNNQTEVDKPCNYTMLQVNNVLTHIARQTTEYTYHCISKSIN